MAKRNVPAVVSAMGILLDVVVSLVAALKRRGADIGEVFYRLGTAEGKQTIEKIADILASTMQAILPPPGGRVHTLTVHLRPTTWREAITAAGPQTGADWNIWKVGDQYPSPTEESERELILANFGRSATSEEVLAWASEQKAKLRPATPYEVFAAGAQYPALHTALGFTVMGIVSLITCFFGGDRRVPSVWWYDQDRRCNLNWFGHRWNDDYWFAFVRE